MARCAGAGGGLCNGSLPTELDPRAKFERAVGAAPGVVLAWDHGGGHMDACSPSWRLLIHADGTVRYLGRRGVRVLGEHDWTMPPARVAQLLARAQPLLEHPPEEVGDLLDATPNCLFVRDGARELLRCVSTGGHADRAANEFGEYLAFKTNAVMWLGEAGGDHCRRPLVPALPAR